MDNNYCVYKHTCPNGKVYIGVTRQNPQRRWGKGSGYRNNAHFYSAIKKYGWDHIEHEIVQTGLSLLQAESEERRLIQEYNSIDPSRGYNNSTGGLSGYRYTDDIKRKISESNKKAHGSTEMKKIQSERSKALWENAEFREKMSRKMSVVAKNRAADPEYRRKMSDRARRQFQDEAFRKRFCEAMADPERRAKLSKLQKERCKNPEYMAKIILAQKARWSDPNFREKMRDVAKKRNSAPETKAKQSAARRKRWQNAEYRSSMSGSNSPSSKPIYQYTLSGDYVNAYKCITDAERAIGISNCRANIIACAKGRAKHAYGFLWAYQNDEKNIEEKVKKLREYVNPKAKAIIQCDAQGNVINCFNSITEAAEHLNGSSGNISAALVGKRKTAYGCIWRYAEGRTV